MTDIASDGCGQPGHFRLVGVDAQGWLYSSCMFPDGTTYHGDAMIYEQLTPSQAEAIRRAVREWTASREGRVVRGGRPST